MNPIDENVKTLMATRQGQEVIWEILGMCDLYSDTFTGDNRAYYHEGKRAVGLMILSMLEEADKAIYPNLLLTIQERDNG